MWILLISLILLITTGCSTQYPNNSITGKTFPTFTGQSLEEKTIVIPTDFTGKATLLLVGYKQNSQFDIDWWLIALDMTETKVDVYEIPTIQGLFPRMFSTMIDNGMRKGIPKELWKALAREYESLKDFNKAFHYLDAAKKFKLK